MNIAIIGSGNIGSGLARTLAATKHGVVLSAKGQQSAQAAIGLLGNGALALKIPVVNKLLGQYA